MFFHFMYTEAPSFFFGMLFFHFLFQKNYKWAAICSFFLPLIRIVGIFTTIPFVWFIFKEWKKGNNPDTTKLIKNLSWATAPFVGWGVYFFIMYLATGDPFEFFKAGKFYKAQGSIWDIFNIPKYIMEIGSFTTIHGYVGSAIDRFWVFPIIPALFILWKYSKTLFFYSFVMVVISSAPGHFTSFTRYIALIFPLFIAYAKFFSKPGREFYKYATVMLLFGIQILFIIRYVNFYWAG